MQPKGPQFDYNALGFPSAEYIVLNLQSLANYAEMNGGSFKMPYSNTVKKLPLKSMVIHVYGEGYIEARLIREKEYKLEKSMEAAQ